MGNRAIVKQAGTDVGVYLHWNGGIDSVTAFLKYCELKGYRGFNDDYGLARFCQVVGNFFGGSLSIGVTNGVGESKRDAKGLDNGVYVVKDWEIVRRIQGDYPSGHEGYSMDEFLKAIDVEQPTKEQLGDFLDAVETPVEDIKIGDIVFVQTIRGQFEKEEVVGIGEDTIVNGNEVSGVPYINRYNGGPDNPNNYLHGDSVRVWIDKKGENDD